VRGFIVVRAIPGAHRWLATDGHLQLWGRVSGKEHLVRNRPPELVIAPLDHLSDFDRDRLTLFAASELLDGCSHCRLITRPFSKDKVEVDSVAASRPLNDQLSIEIRVV
jgi:hypothetical protein